MSVTGKGAAPLRSTWMKLVPQLYNYVGSANKEADTAQKDVWTDWFFAAAPTPPPVTNKEWFILRERRRGSR